MSAELQHTPGPWAEIDDRIFSVGYVLTGAPVATVHARNRRGVRKANARLIAAAPEMLEALNQARDFIRNGVDLGYIRMPDADCPDPAHKTLPAIEAATSKATGKEAQE